MSAKQPQVRIPSPVPLPEGVELPKKRPAVPAGGPPAGAVPVRLALTWFLPDAQTADRYEQVVRLAFARSYPALIRVQTGIGDDEAPVYADDPLGVIERQLIQHVADVVLAAQRDVAAELARRQTEAEVQAMIDAVPAVVTVTSG